MKKEIYVLIGLVAIFSLVLVLPAKAGALDPVTVTPSNVYGSQTANYTAEFRVVSDTPATAQIKLTFPAGFNITNVGTSTASTSVDGVLATSTASASGTDQVVTLFLTGGSEIPALETIAVTITTIVNPTVGGSITVIAETLYLEGDGIDIGTSAAFTIIACCQTRSAPRDTTPPISKITSPIDGLTITAGKKYIIEGYGTDEGGSAVKSVEISLDGGQKWSSAQSSAAGGSFSWQYVWENPTEGEYTIKVRATDSAANIESPSAGIKVTVSAAVPSEAPVEVSEKLLTEAQITSILSLLDSFGVDTTTRANVETSLRGGTPSAPSGVPAACAGITSFMVNLTVGSTGADVKCLQVLLNTSADTQVAATGVGSAGNETTYFGPMTKAAVIKYQTKNAISPAVGYVGPLTRTALSTILTTIAK